MKRAAFLLAGILGANAVAEAQTTIFFRRDHIYAGPGGAEIATVTPPPSDTTAPTAPSGLGTASTTATSVALSWTGSSDSGGSSLLAYVIYRQKGSGASLPVGTVSSSSTSFTDQPLEPSTGYSWVVFASDGAHNLSSASNSVTATTSAASTDTQAPSAPVQLTGMVMSATSVQLNWLAASDLGGSGIGSYQIKRGGSVIATVGATVLAYLDTTVSASTSYSYTVVARDNISSPNVSSDSNSVTLNTGQEIIPPTMPANFEVTAYEKYLRFTWGISTDSGGSGLAGYRVYYGTTLISGTNPVTTPYFYYSSLNSNTTYANFTVKAVDNAGNASLPAGPVSGKTLPDVTAPNPPASLTHNGSGMGVEWVQWSWPAAADDTGGSGIAGYRLYAIYGMDEYYIGETTGLTYYLEFGFTGVSQVLVRSRDNAGNLSYPMIWEP